MDAKIPELSKWNPQIKPCTMMGIFAPRDGGKTFFVGDFLCKNAHRFHEVVVINPSEIIHKFYQSLSSSLLIFQRLDQEVLNAIDMLMERQITIGSDVAKERRLLIIMDNCATAGKKILKQLYQYRKSHNFTLLVTAQYLFDIPEEVMKDLDVSVIFKQLTFDEKICKRFNFVEEITSKLLEKYTSNFGVVVKDNVTKQCFWYKADSNISTQKIIFNKCPIIKKIGESYTKNWIDRQQPFDQKNYFKFLLSLHEQYAPNSLERQLLRRPLIDSDFFNYPENEDIYSKILFTIEFVRDYLTNIKLPQSLCDLIFSYDMNYFYSGFIIADKMTDLKFFKNEAK